MSTNVKQNPLKMDLQFFSDTATAEPPAGNAPDAQNHIDASQKAWKQARDLMDKYDNPDDMPADEQKQVDGWLDEVDAEQAKAERAQRVADGKKHFDVPQRKHPIGAEDQTPEEKKDIQKKQHQKAFRSYMREGKSGMEPDEKKLLSSLSDPEGGFLVPEDFRAELIRKRRNLTFIRAAATVIETNSASVGFPTFDYDGDAEWTAENEKIAQEDVTNAFGKTTFVPHKLARILRVPNELTEDAAINVESLLTDHFAMRFGEIEENAFINGDGNDKPLGILQSGLDTSSATDDTGTFTADDLFNVIYDIRAVYRNGGSWLMPRNAVRRARTLKTADNQYLWQPGLQAGQPSTLLGFPLQESEFFPDNVDAGNAGDPLLMFGDWTFYWIIDRIDMSIQRLVERYAEFDQIGFKMRERVDGAPVQSDPFEILVRS